MATLYGTAKLKFANNIIIVMSIWDPTTNLIPPVLLYCMTCIYGETQIH